MLLLSHPLRRKNLKFPSACVALLCNCRWNFKNMKPFTVIHVILSTRTHAHTFPKGGESEREIRFTPTKRKRNVENVETCRRHIPSTLSLQCHLACEKVNCTSLSVVHNAHAICVIYIEMTMCVCTLYTSMISRNAVSTVAGCRIPIHTGSLSNLCLIESLDYEAHG